VSLPSVRESREDARALMRLHHSNIMMSALRPVAAVRRALRTKARDGRHCAMLTAGSTNSWSIPPRPSSRSPSARAKASARSEPTIAAMLGHASGTVTGRYIHHLDSVLIAAASRVAARIDATMSGAGGEVLAFERPGR
jgi:integrase